MRYCRRNTYTPLIGHRCALTLFLFLVVTPLRADEKECPKQYIRVFSKSFFSIRAGQFDERGKEIGVYACSHCDANVYRLLESAQQLDLDVSGTYVTIFYKPGTSRREQRRVLRPQNRRVSQRSGWNYHTVWDTGNILDLDYGTNPRWPRKTSFILKMFGTFAWRHGNKRNLSDACTGRDLFS